MRIISGKYRGSKLVSFKDNHIRPTTDRVKESLFNTIAAYVPEAEVLDLFSGTGSLGLEALSRGASSVIFVDKNKLSIKILKKNIETLKVENGYSISQIDVMSYLSKNNFEKKFDVIFIDPPFTEKMADKVMAAVATANLLNDEGIICIESSDWEKIKDSYEGLELYKRKSYGDKHLSMYIKKQV